MADEFRDLRKLQTSQFDAWEKQQDIVDRVLLKNYKAAYNASIKQIADLYAKVGIEDPRDGVFIRKEDAIHYNQLANRLSNIETEIKKLEKSGVKLTEENSAQSVQDGYYRNQWAYDQTVGVNLPIPALPIDAIRASVYSDKSGLDLVSTWNKNTTDQIYKTRSAITRGITLGQSYTKVARSIKTEFDKGLWQAMRVVRTEAGRNWSEGAEASHVAAKEAGLDIRKRWSAALDSRTRLSHANLDGTYADDEGLFYLGGEGQPQPRLFSDPAESINCRCSTIDVLDGITPEVRRIRNDDGKGSEILPYQTFAEWGAERGWKPTTGWPKKSL
jgi:hypothetical protein